ncbi:MAG: alpha/beta hydrolase family protein [Gammaproteobacteria bacterium]
MTHSFFARSLFLTCVCISAMAQDNASLPQHGKVISTKEINTSVSNAKAWRISYWSTTINDEVVPVSGIVIAPATSDSKKMLHIVTWGHGTSGISNHCAPSLAKHPARDAVFYYHPNSDEDFDYGIPGLSEMIAAGYVVVATDYNGLGSPGIHQYLIGSTEARNMMDAAIAVQQMPEIHAGNEVVAIGWSQGGQASVWAAQLADYLSGHANLVGAVSLAPVNADEQIRIMHKITSEGKKLRPVTATEMVMAWYAMTLVFPELKLNDMLTDNGIKFLTESIKSQCSHHMSDSLGYFEEYVGPAIRVDRKNQDKWDKRIAENSLGNIPAKVPLAVYQGDADLAIFPETTTAYVEKVCKQGATIEYHLYKGVDHIGLSAYAQKDFLAWISDRFSGKKAKSTCGS